MPQACFFNLFKRACLRLFTFDSLEAVAGKRRLSQKTHCREVGKPGQLNLWLRPAKHSVSLRCHE